MNNFSIYFMLDGVKRRFFCPFVDGAGTALKRFHQRYPDITDVSISGPPYQVYSKNGKGRKTSLGSFHDLNSAVKTVIREWVRKPNTKCTMEFEGKDFTPATWLQ